MAQLKLSLSLADLQQLIGDTNPVSLEIKTSIIHAFAKQTLAPLLKDTLTQQFSKEVTDLIEKAIRKDILELIGRADGFSITLDPRIRQLIRTVVEGERHKAINESVAAALTTEMIDASVQRVLEHYLNDYVRVAVRQYLADHIEQVAKEELEKLLKK